MKINQNKKRNPSMPETKALSIKQITKKAKIDVSNTGQSPSIEVIDLSDSEESTNSSQQEQSTNKPQVTRKQDEQNCSQTNGTLINQLLQMNGSLVGEEIDIQDNPNEIFFYEDFDLEDTNNSVGSSEQADEIDENSKFFGISKLVRARCSTCKVNYKDINDNQLRYLRKCSECQSPMLFQCRKCAKFYKYFQSIWDHIMRSCQKMQIYPSILDLALGAANKRDEIPAPPVITLESDDDNKESVDFVNCDSTLPFRIQSVESRIDMEDDSMNDCPTKKEKLASSCAMPTFKQGNVNYECYKCEFKGDSAREVRRHIIYAHSEHFAKDGNIDCTKCKKPFKSLQTKKEHEAQCRGKFYYKCKFCQLTARDSTVLKKHLIARHSMLFQKHESEGVVMEIKCSRKIAKDMFKNFCTTEPSDEEDSLQATADQIISEIEIKYNKSSADLSNINELLKIRCCKCKVTFESVEEKGILHCQNCQSELLYSCRLCNKLFAFFGKAWSHVSYHCKLATKSNIDTQQPKIRSKTNGPLRETYSCNYCDFTAPKKYQVSQHMQIWHSCMNDDLQIKFTACSRCGRAFEKLEDCAIHEQFMCGKETMLVCEFCPRIEDRVEPMRIHLAKMHLKQLGSLRNLENVMNSIKKKRQSMRGLSAMPVPNQRDDYMKMEEC